MESRGGFFNVLCCAVLYISTVVEFFNVLYVQCNCILTRGGVYDEILPEPEGNPIPNNDLLSFNSCNIT